MLKRLGLLLLELVVVFVGVYAAFALNTWREDRRDDARRQQILQTLRSHVAWVDESVSAARPAVESTFIVPFLDSLEAGEMPDLEPISFTSGEVGTGLWEVMLQAGGLDVLDAPTIELMHQYFAGLQQGMNTLEDAKEQADLHLYPNLGRERDEFYDAETGRLRPRYGWYPRALRRMQNHFKAIDTLGDSVLVHLDSLLGHPPADSLAAR